MKLHYYPDTDTLYIEFSDRTGPEGAELAEDIYVGYDTDGGITGMTIEGASAKLDLHSLETLGFPIQALKVA